jgi:hypothetical protein
VEERGRHADVAGIIPILPFTGHLSCTVGTQGGEAIPAREFLSETCDATWAEHDIVVEEHHPRRRAQSFRPVSCPRDRLETIAIDRRRSSLKAVDAQVDPAL